MSDDNILDQDEIERLLNSGLGAAPSASNVPSASNDAAEDGPMSQAELEALFGSGGAAPPPIAPTPPVIPAADKILGQNEIESMLKGAGAPSGPPPQAPKFSMGGGAAAAIAASDEEGVPQGDLDYILKRAEDAIHSISSNQMDLPSEVIEFQFPEFGGTIPSSDHATLDQISEVELDIKIELGRANMYLEDVLKLRKGSVVPLDKMAGDAVDIYVNGRLLARGEVLVMNENFCVRVAELLAGAIPME